MGLTETGDWLEPDNEAVEIGDLKKEKENLQELKEEVFEEWTSKLKEIGSQEVYEMAIDNTESIEALSYLRKSLLANNPEDSEVVKELVKKMQKRK